MRVLKWFLSLLVLLLAIALVVAWTMPASLAWRFVAPRVPVLQLSDVGGSVWNGHASEVRVAGQPLGSLAWQTEWLPLLRGDVRVHARVEGAGQSGSGLLTRQRDGLILVHEAEAELPGSILQGVLGIDELRLGGTLHLAIREAHIRNAWFTQLDARGLWERASVSGAAEAHLGDVEVVFSEPSPPVLVGDIRDSGHGPLTIQGQLSAQPSGYVLEARLRARNPDDLRTQEALKYVGQRQSDGSVLLRAGGALMPPPRP